MARGNPGRPAIDDSVWRSLPDCTRALVVRGSVDHQMIAIERQHERIQEYGREVFEVGLLSLPRGGNMRGLVDTDFFLTSVRRLRRACVMARKSALPAAASLRLPIRLFAAQVDAVIPVRDFLEHFDEATIEGRTGLGLGITPEQITITYGGATLDSLKLLAASRLVHRSIRAVVDPVAVDDVHYLPPLIDLAPATAKSPQPV